MKRFFIIGLLISLMALFIGCTTNAIRETDMVTVEPTRLLPTPTATEPATATTRPTPVPTVAVSFEVENFADENVAPVCTELGCNNSLWVYFAEFQPDNYIVEVAGLNEDKVILHCFAPNTDEDLPYNIERFALSSPRLKHYQAMSPAFEKCGTDEAGMATVVTRADDSVDQIVVFCGGWIDYVSDPSYDGRVECYTLYDSFQIDYPIQQLPEMVSMIVSWDTFTKTFTFEPQYEVYRPNGPACEPECFETDIFLSLP